MPVTKFSTPEKYQYLNGFQNYHESVLPFLLYTIIQLRSELQDAN